MLAFRSIPRAITEFQHGHVQTLRGWPAVAALLRACRIVAASLRRRVVSLSLLSPTCVAPMSGRPPVDARSFPVNKHSLFLSFVMRLVVDLGLYKEVVVQMNREKYSGLYL